MEITARMQAIFKRNMLGRKHAFRALKACVDSGLPVYGYAVPFAS